MLPAGLPVGVQGQFARSPVPLESQSFLQTSRPAFSQRTPHPAPPLPTEACMQSDVGNAHGGKGNYLM